MNLEGRPSDYSEETAVELCNRIAEGNSLKSVCEAKDMPDKATVYRWLFKYSEFRDKYAHACQQRTEAQNELLLELGDEAITLSQEVNEKASNAVVSAVKLKADNLKWVMSKQKPKKYGDTLDLTSKGDKLPTPIYGGLSRHNSDETNLSTEEEN